MARSAWLLMALVCPTVLLAQSPPMPGLPEAHNALRGDVLMHALRGGGYTLYFRHAVRDTRITDSASLTIADCSTQAPLADVGRGQSRAIGLAIARLGIPVGEVLASPYCRTMDTARLLASGMLRPGSVEVIQSADAMQPPQLAQRLAAPVAWFGVRVIVGDGEAFSAVAGSPALEAGEAVVLRPGDAGAWVVVARLRAADWDGLAAAATADAVGPGLLKP